MASFGKNFCQALQGGFHPQLSMNYRKARCRLLLNCLWQQSKEKGTTAHEKVYLEVSGRDQGHFIGVRPEGARHNGSSLSISEFPAG